MNTATTVLAGTRAWWDRELFCRGEHPDQVCPPVFDVTGQVRLLAFGPFITLPTGLWRAEVVIDACEQAARRSYLLEFGAGENLSREAFAPLSPGRNILPIEHHFASPSAAELRFWVARAAFDGHLSFLGATIELHRQAGSGDDAAIDEV
jgi:hypothetical protein